MLLFKNMFLNIGVFSVARCKFVEGKITKLKSCVCDYYYFKIVFLV